ncbi:MAG: YceI family protein [bacterium]|nr:YceI family protein [bacterium]
MKKNAFFAIIAAGALLASCGAEETTETTDETGDQKQEMAAESVTYSLNTEESTLYWEGFEGEHESHVGTLKFSEGSMTMKGDAVESGSFVVDMTTINVTDEGMPEKSKNKLEGHLGAEDVWNIAQYATTTVTLGDYSDGKLSVKINVLGKAVETTVPVTISTDDKGAKLSGKFEVDFSSLNVPLFEPQEEEDESISPVIAFEIDAVLTK